MRKPMVAGNWKLNGSRVSVQALVEGILSGSKAVTKADIVVCPPYVFISDVARQLGSSAVAVGAQDVAKETSGAFTGEVSVDMLKDVGCRYAIIGHSERRSLYGDTDEMVAQKVDTAIKGGVTPILCVGELLEEREGGQTEAVVERQLKAVVDHCGIDTLGQCVVAYEPVWAIGTGKTASPEQAQEVHAFIRNWIRGQSAKVADTIRILYGGSVKGDNAAELFSQADIDGGLIGGASLDADEFLTICKAAG
ncbi:MAG: triose-phosphate isomerase [Gammaproteobacteria bacterium]|nr:triose-phosphate isomerase [Gammaproteobacteria bacterium]